MSDVHTVVVAADRLKALEELEASLPALIAKERAQAVLDAKRERLQKLNEENKKNPKAHSDSVLKKYHENKEEINAKRRAAYQAKKAAAEAAIHPSA
jgi:hypothetical protein